MKVGDSLCGCPCLGEWCAAEWAGVECNPHHEAAGENAGKGKPTCGLQKSTCRTVQRHECILQAVRAVLLRGHTENACVEIDSCQFRMSHNNFKEHIVGRVGVALERICTATVYLHGGKSERGRAAACSSSMGVKHGGWKS